MYRKTGNLHMRYLFDNVNTPRGERIIASLDYSIEDENHASCDHAGRCWLVDDMVICPACGAVVAYVETQTNAQTGTDAKTIYLDGATHYCMRCGGELDIVRPGKWQCPNCE